jgi:hypothetical protein
MTFLIAIAIKVIIGLVWLVCGAVALAFIIEEIDPEGWAIAVHECEMEEREKAQAERDAARRKEWEERFK